MAIRLDGRRAASTTDPGTHLRAANVLSLGANGEAHNQVTIFLRLKTPYVFDPVEDDSLTILSPRDRASPQDYLFRCRADVPEEPAPHPYYFGTSMGPPTIEHYLDKVEPPTPITINTMVGLAFRIDFSGSANHPGTITVDYLMEGGSHQRIVLDRDGAGSAVATTMRKLCIGGHTGTAASYPLQSDVQNFEMDCQDVMLSYLLWSDDDVETICAGTSPLEFLGTNLVYGRDDFWPMNEEDRMFINATAGPSGDLSAPNAGASFIPNFSGADTLATVALTLVADSWIDKSDTTTNHGAETTSRLHANAAGTLVRRLVQRWTGLSGLPAGATEITAALTMQCSTVTSASAQQINARRLTRTIIEGDGLSGSGVDWDTYDGVQAWTAAGGDLGTANENIGTSPIATGSVAYDVTDCLAEQLAAGGDEINLCVKRNTESGTLSNVLYDTREGTVPPTLIITYTLPDTTTPEVGIDTPTASPTYKTKAATIAIAGTASDDVAVAAVTWSNNRGGSGAAVGTDNWSVASIPLALGVNVITITAADAAANQGTDVIIVTRTLANQSPSIAASIAAADLDPSTEDASA